MTLAGSSSNNRPSNTTGASLTDHNAPKQHRGLVPQASFVRPSSTSRPDMVRSTSTSSSIAAAAAAATTIMSATDSTPQQQHRAQHHASSKASAATPVRSTSAGAPSTRKQEAILPHAQVEKAPPTYMYWSKTPVQGRIPKGLRAHSATLVGNDVWCFGGCDARGTCFKDVWRFDCDTLTWTKPRVTGQIPPVTRAHTATMALREYIFVFGGGDGPTYYNDVYIFDTVCLSWSKPFVRGRAPSKRRAHTSFVYHDKILVFGGGNGANALNDLHALDVSDLEDLCWASLSSYGDVPGARGYHTMNLVTGLDGSKCVVFGGSDGSECFGDVFILDLDTLTWSNVNFVVSLQEEGEEQQLAEAGAYPRLSHTTTTIGSNLLVFGGHDGVTFSNDVLLFNLVTLQWEQRTICGVPPSPRGYHATVLHDSRIFVFGGFNGQQVFDEVWTLELAGSAFLPQITNFQVGDPLEFENEQD
ncbi:hypothetical protein OIO90_005558 [Microbotryomycetes sp. JL221]|nr:hypothetical protein OIO90_005558 [Microbotryomycetes sp. JL221]